MSDTFWTGMWIILTNVGVFVAAHFETWRKECQEKKRRRREAIGHALSVLLEVHGQVAIYRAIDELIKLTPDVGTNSPALVMQMMKMLEEILTDLTPLDQEYAEAIRSLAGEYPVLASDIRDSHRILKQARAMVKAVASGALGVAESNIEAYSEFMHATAFELLTEKARALGEEHGGTTKNEVNDHLEEVRWLKWELVTMLEAKLPARTWSLPEEDREAAMATVGAWRKSIGRRGAVTLAQAPDMGPEG